MKLRYPIIDDLLCKGCGRCAIACPKSVLKMGKRLNRYGFRYVEYVGDGCIGCGSCFYACPEPEAIQVIEDRSSSADKDKKGKTSA